MPAIERERARNAERQDTVGDWIVEPLEGRNSSFLTRTPFDLDPRVLATLFRRARLSTC